MNFDEKRICAELWDVYKDSIRKVCSIKLRSCPNEIDDVVSDVYLALCKKVSETGAPEKPKEWLFGTLRNLLNKKYKEIYSLRENETAFSETEIDLPYLHNDIHTKETEIYLEELNKAAKNVLSDEEWLLMNLIHFNRLKHKEIAVMQNSTESAVKQKHYRICNKLRKAAKKLEN